MFRVLYGELCGDLCDLAEYENPSPSDGSFVNDCKSLADALLAAGSAASKTSEDKRLGIELSMIKQRLSRNETRFQWVEGATMPASSAGVAVPSRTRRLTTSIFSSNFSFASSAPFTNLCAASSSSLWRCQERLRQEELHSRGVQGVATTQNRLCEEGHRGSHVTDRGCLLGEWRVQQARSSPRAPLPRSWPASVRVGR